MYTTVLLYVAHIQPKVWSLLQQGMYSYISVQGHEQFTQWGGVNNCDKVCMIIVQWWSLCKVFYMTNTIYTWLGDLFRHHDNVHE